MQHRATKATGAHLFRVGHRIICSVQTGRRSEHELRNTLFSAPFQEIECAGTVGVHVDPRVFKALPNSRPRGQIDHGIKLR
jgi:hypothetical protein